MTITRSTKGSGDFHLQPQRVERINSANFFEIVNSGVFFQMDKKEAVFVQPLIFASPIKKDIEKDSLLFTRFSLVYFKFHTPHTSRG